MITSGIMMYSNGTNETTVLPVALRLSKEELTPVADCAIIVGAVDKITDTPMTKPIAANTISVIKLPIPFIYKNNENNFYIKD